MANAKEELPKKKADPINSASNQDIEVPSNVLIVDDSKELRSLIVEFLLVKFNSRVFEAENGKEGLKIITESNIKIHLVLCDIMMPIMDGITFLKELKSSDSTQLVPVIFFTGKNDKETVTECIKLGASDFIVKPYDIDSMTKKIEKFIKLRS